MRAARAGLFALALVAAVPATGCSLLFDSNLEPASDAALSRDTGGAAVDASDCPAGDPSGLVTLGSFAASSDTQASYVRPFTGASGGCPTMLIVAMSWISDVNIDGVGVTLDSVPLTPLLARGTAPIVTQFFYLTNPQTSDGDIIVDFQLQAAGNTVDSNIAYGLAYQVRTGSPTAGDGGDNEMLPGGGGGVTVLTGVGSATTLAMMSVLDADLTVNPEPGLVWRQSAGQLRTVGVQSTRGTDIEFINETAVQRNGAFAFVRIQPGPQP